MVGSTPSIHQVNPRILNSMMSARGVEQICSHSMKDTRTLINNLVYENFKKSYSEPAWSSCSNNVMIHLQNIAHDTASQYYLTNSRIVNGDFGNIVRYDNPDASTAGWLGGCGAIGPCKGTETFVITDFDGQFFG